MAQPRPGSSTTAGFQRRASIRIDITCPYYGRLGKQNNCQVAVSLSVANHAASLPIAYRIYLPEDLGSDPERRSKIGVPDDVAFRTKLEIALDQIRAALSTGIPRGTVLMGAGYGADTKLRTAITEFGLTYAAGIQLHTSVWWPSEGPLPRTADELVASRCRAPARQGEGSRAGAADVGVGDDHLA